MKIKTHKFGEVEIDDNKVLTMPLGLAGFPGRKRFALLEREETRPFCWFQSIEDPKLALVVMNPVLFMPDYTIDIKPVVRELEWEDDPRKAIAVYVVLSIHEQGPYRITANLIGPIVINTLKREACQMVIYESPYSHQHPVMAHPEPPQKRAVGD